MLIHSQANAWWLISQQSVAESGGVTCSGDMSDGDNESFESGAGSFCTTDWTEADTDGVVDTYSSTDANCGTHSLAIVCDGDNANEPNNRAYVQALVSGTPNDMMANVRFYIKLPSLANGQYLRFFSVGDDNNETTAGQAYLQWFNNGGTYRLSLRNPSTDSSEYFALTPGAWYRFEMTVKDSSANNSTLRVYDSSDTSVFSSTGDPDVEINNTSGDLATMEYFIFRDFNSSTAGVTYYIDDVLIDVNGGGEVGAQVCN